MEYLLKKLAEEIPYHWRVQSFSKKSPKAVCVPYIDARQVMDRLDELGLLWQDEYKDVSGKVYCRIGIFVDDQWIWRSDVGSESNIEADKGQASDAFKRAAVKWGIGRFLYNKIPVVVLPASEKKTNTSYPYVTTADGKQVYNLTKHINTMHEKLSPGDKPVNINELKENYLELWKHYETLVGSNRASGSHPDNWKVGDESAFRSATSWIEREISKIESLKNG